MGRNFSGVLINKKDRLQPVFIKRNIKYMSKQTTKTTLASIDKKQTDAALQFANVANRASEVYLNASGSNDMAQALNAANAMQEIRQAMTPEVLAIAKPLMNSPLGFLTDRDPTKSRRQVELYSDQVIADCIIEASLRGLNLIGNQFNIIAGRCYVTKQGWDYLIKKKVNGLRMLKVIPSPAKVHKDSSGNVTGAFVKVTVSWELNGKTEGFEAEFAVKGDNYMGPDGFTGKAESKALKRVFHMLTGLSLPDADDGETINNDADQNHGQDDLEKPVSEDSTAQGEVGNDSRRAVRPDYNSNLFAE